MRLNQISTATIRYPHDHSFGQDRTKAGERRTLAVLCLTTTTMFVEIAAGIAYNSMALLADGLHMASHSAALLIAAIAYMYVRRHARDERYSFGTGKVNALAAFASAVILALFALFMVEKSIDRFLNPVTIGFNQAILVAAFGLFVNAVSVVILGGHGDGDRHGGEGHDHDHNLRAAYLHVVVDALTSLLAIAALLAGKFLGLNWMDPAMAIVGAALVARWSWGLLRDSSRILLDRQAPRDLRESIREVLQTPHDRITDLHVWSVGPQIYAASIAVVTTQPRQPEYYKALLPADMGLVHATVEVNHVFP